MTQSGYRIGMVSFIVRESERGPHHRLSLQPPLLCAFLFSVTATVEVNLPFLFFSVSVLCIYGPVAEMVIGINRILSWVVDTNFLMRLLTSLRLMIEVPGFNLILFGVYLHWNRLRNVRMMRFMFEFCLDGHLHMDIWNRSSVKCWRILLMAFVCLGYMSVAGFCDHVCDLYDVKAVN